MKYSSHLQNAKIRFPELDLLDENEFGLFKNEKFAIFCTNLCLNLCDKASERLNITLNFSVQFNYTFNATAKVRNQQGVIVFNLGLIEKLDSIISDSVNMFSSENLASLTIQANQADELKDISKECCISYIFYHELAHVIQLLDSKSNKKYGAFQELYSTGSSFDIVNHIYEFDADLFGSIMSALRLIKNVKNNNNQFDIIILFNSLTVLLFTTANIIIEYSGDLFKIIYYKQFKHPHPFIRTMKCNEQILSFISENLNVPKPFFEVVLQRTATMISQILYSDGRTVNYPEFYMENSIGIDAYINEIEHENERYKELTRFKSQEIFDALNE